MRLSESLEALAAFRDLQGEVEMGRGVLDAFSLVPQIAAGEEAFRRLLDTTFQAWGFSLHAWLWEEATNAR